MFSIPVKAEHDYLVNIGVDWRSSLFEISAKYSQSLIIAPSSLKESLVLPQENIYYTRDGEDQKDISEVIELWKKLGEIGFGRKGAIIAIGGGATTDLAGFVAATWLRGVDWYAFPTTLAAMVDASVGGKTGINTESGKNLVGAFYSPRSVEIDLRFLDSLSDRDFSAGMAEVIKTGLIADESILQLIEQEPSLSGARENAQELIAKSITVKARVVSADFREGREREILNFGHTFGHAVEKISAYGLRHGEAVAIGTIYALHLSEELAGLDSSVRRRVENIFMTLGLPLSVTSLPESLNSESLLDFSWERALALMYGDKKAYSGSLRFIGISSVGQPVWFESVPDETATRIYERISL